MPSIIFIHLENLRICQVVLYAENNYRRRPSDVPQWTPRTASTHAVPTFGFVGHILQSAYVTWVKAHRMIETAAYCASSTTHDSHPFHYSVTGTVYPNPCLKVHKMKTIGILGGMSAESTQVYYRQLCSLTRERLGGLHSPELLIRSLDFSRIQALQDRGEWDEAGSILNTEAKALERGGADFIILATNTMHKVADQMMKDVSVPMIHIADATAARIQARGLSSPGLMATAFTMEQTFYVDRLIAAGLSPIIPDSSNRAKTHQIIYDELCRGLVTKESEDAYVRIANQLIARGADCIILGCTEVGMLLNQDNLPVPVFDTTMIHCDAAIDSAFEDVTGPAN